MWATKPILIAATTVFLCGCTSSVKENHTWFEQLPNGSFKYYVKETPLFPYGPRDYEKWFGSEIKATKACEKGHVITERTKFDSGNLGNVMDYLFYAKCA